MKKTNYVIPYWCVVFLVFVLLQALDRIYWQVGCGTFLHVLSWAALLSVPALFSGKWARYFLFIELLYVSFWEFLELYGRFCLHMSLDGNMVFILSATNPQEVMTFLKMLGFWQVAVIMILIAGLVCGLWFICYRLNAKKDKVCLGGWIRLAFIGCILVFWLLCNAFYLFPQPNKRIFEQCQWLACSKSVIKTTIEFREIIGTLQHNQFPCELRLQEMAAHHPPVGIIVIGESSCRNYWHIYGEYSRQTTPKLDSIRNELLLFNDVCGSATETSTGLLHLFATKTVLADGLVVNASLPNLLMRAGVSCSIISTQAGGGKISNFQNALFAAIPEKKYLTNEETEERCDLSILPNLQLILQKVDASMPTCLFIHTMGNHFPCTKYPKECAIFDGCIDEETKGVSSEVLKARNGYDNTMVCTDYVLFSIIDLAKKFLKGRPAFVLFVSDHGETPRQPWRHAASRDLWELPMVLWMNDEYKASFSEFATAARAATDIPMTSDRLFWGMCSLMQVTCQAFPEQEDIFSKKYLAPVQRRVYRGKYLYTRDGEGEFLAE